MRKNAYRGIAVMAVALLAVFFVSCQQSGLDDGIYARMKTSKGEIIIKLDYEGAPLTVCNFVGLATGKLDATKGKPFYDGLTFHRVVDDFVIQGGDPRGDGSGGPGWTLRSELSRAPFERGTVGIADSGRDTGGSQFFVTHSPQPHLEARYTVFARVVAGMEVVDRLQPWDEILRVRVWDGKAYE